MSVFHFPDSRFVPVYNPYFQPPGTFLTGPASPLGLCACAEHFGVWTCIQTPGFSPGFVYINILTFDLFPTFHEPLEFSHP